MEAMTVNIQRTRTSATSMKEDRSLWDLRKISGKKIWECVNKRSKKPDHLLFKANN